MPVPVPNWAVMFCGSPVGHDITNEKKVTFAKKGSQSQKQEEDGESQRGLYLQQSKARPNGASVLWSSAGLPNSPASLKFSLNHPPLRCQECWKRKQPQWVGGPMESQEPRAAPCRELL